MTTKKKLYRSRDDRMLTGLAAGIADYFNVDVSLVRVALVILEFFSVGFLIIAYFIVSLIVPLEPEAPKKVSSERKS